MSHNGYIIWDLEHTRRIAWIEFAKTASAAWAEYVKYERLEDPKAKLPKRSEVDICKAR